MSIVARDIRKSFGSFTALHDVELSVARGELVALLGPSGSGKTTLLRILAGLESLDGGSLELFGAESSATHVSQRDVGFVFQHFALFSHMSVFDNVAFGLNVLPTSKRPRPAEIKKRVEELLELVQLSSLKKRFPAQLSGGQRQRVALARALATSPRYLLLDEPFGALDARVRLELRAWLRELHDQLRLTTILVTHDQEEALDLADRVVLMDAGRIIQSGSPSELLDLPQTPFVFDFLGGGALLDGTLHRGQVHVGPWIFPAPELARDDFPRPIRVGIRAHDLEICAEERGFALLTRVDPRGDHVKLSVLFDGGSVMHARHPRHDPRLMTLRAGRRVSVAPRSAHLFGDDFAAHLHLDPLLTATTARDRSGKSKEITNEINVL